MHAERLACNEASSVGACVYASARTFTAYVRSNLANALHKRYYARYYMLHKKRTTPYDCNRDSYWLRLKRQKYEVFLFSSFTTEWDRRVRVCDIISALADSCS